MERRTKHSIEAFRARVRSGTVGTFLASATCRCGTYLIPAAAAVAERRSAGSRYEAAKSGGEALQRSTRSPRGGMWLRSAGMRPDSLSSPEGGPGKRLCPYQQNLDAERATHKKFLLVLQEEIRTVDREVDHSSPDAKEYLKHIKDSA